VGQTPLVTGRRSATRGRWAPASVRTARPGAPRRLPTC